MTSFATRPSRDPGPVLIWYDVSVGGRPGRACRRFATGGGRTARNFYAQMLREGRNPVVKPAPEEGPGLFPPAGAEA
jgi:hypothetical protein